MKETKNWKILFRKSALYNSSNILSWKKHTIRLKLASALLHIFYEKFIIPIFSEISNLTRTVNVYKNDEFWINIEKSSADF